MLKNLWSSLDGEKTWIVILLAVGTFLMSKVAPGTEEAPSFWVEHFNTIMASLGLTGAATANHALHKK